MRQPRSLRRIEDAVKRYNTNLMVVLDLRARERLHDVFHAADRRMELTHDMDNPHWRRSV
jgi:hypothetical protein